MSVKASPISKTAAILIIALGLLTLLAGVSTGILESTVAGVAITALGLVLYRLLYVFTKKVRRELEGQPS